MSHGVVDVFAYQEALLMEAVFGLIILAMIWARFRRWIQHKERIERLIADESVARAAQSDRVEARLEAIEQIVAGGTSTAAIDSVTRLADSPARDAIPKA